MAIGKFDSIYNKLSEDLEEIRKINSYNNLSLAFSHWFLKNQYGLSEQEIAEAIIDGNGDYGIDAVIHNEFEKSLEIFQFKFPSSTKTIRNEIKQSDVYKLLSGFDYLIDEQGEFELSNASDDFMRIHDELKTSEIHNFKINFVSFNQGVVDNMEIINNFISRKKRELGIEFNYYDYDVRKVTNIYEKLQRQNSTSITLPYKNLQQSYSANGTDSYVGLVNARALLKSLDDVIGVVFDENIRLHEIKSKINDGIKKTSSGQDSSMFYFYNNGITFICDQVSLSPSNLTAKLEGASIVNGCQTVTSLYENFIQEHLKEDVDLLVRITKISDYDERANITRFLNSQNPIKESYFISNHTIIRDLQTKLLKLDYYLERQVNESSYKEKFAGDDTKNGKVIIKLDDAIQYYAGYFLDKFTATAKRNKNMLFNGETVEEILSEITAERVVEAHTTYLKVSEVITAYRRQRRNKNNTEFARLLGITNEILDSEERSYLFMNTADILLLNTCKFMKNKFPENDINKNIIESINLIISVINENDELKNMTPASLTKNQKIYSEVKNKF
ncbi:AIPR family protein [Lactococcus petauri]|uniref:AIPR family protein n=1 Tax=Lactococcus petauri TaxID=1940789 RepID=UPI003851FD21